MTASDWQEALFAGGGALFVLASFAGALLVMLVEVVALHLRGRTIRGHLGWERGFPRPRDTERHPAP